MDSTDDAKIDERQVYLTFKSIFASDGSKDKLRKRILNHKRIDVNAKQLAMDYGLEVVIKTAESMVDDKLFTSSDIAGSRFKNLSNEEMPVSVDETYESPLTPVVIPFKTQHLVMTQLQKFLERICYVWCKRHWVGRLEEKGWDCAESVELSEFIKEMQELESEEEFVAEGGKTWKKIYRSISEIRHTAVHREHTTTKGMEQLLLDSEYFARAFDPEQEHTRPISELHLHVTSTIESMRQHKQKLELKLREVKSSMAEQRKELDRKEAEAIAAIMSEDNFEEMAGAELEEKLDFAGTSSILATREVDAAEVGGKDTAHGDSEPVETLVGIPATREVDAAEVGGTDTTHDDPEPVETSVGTLATTEVDTPDASGKDATHDDPEPVETSASTPATTEVDTPDVGGKDMAHDDSEPVEAFAGTSATTELSTADIKETSTHQNNADSAEASFNAPATEEDLSTSSNKNII